MSVNEADREPGMSEDMVSEPVSEPGARGLEDAVRAALRAVEDPEMGIDVVRLGLIRDVRLVGNDIRIVMILTSPFCPYGGMLIQQVVDAARPFAAGEVQVEMGQESWTPAMMDDADLADWGLI